MDLVRAKSEALDNIYIWFQQNIKSCNAKRRRQRRRTVKINNRSNWQKRNFARAAHFFLYISLPFFVRLQRESSRNFLDPVYMEWGTPVQWGKFLLFCVPQSVKTKETYPTRPGSPTPCKQALSYTFYGVKCRTFSRSLFIHSRSLSHCIDGRQHFSFCHHSYKIVMLFFQQKNVSFVFYLSLQISVTLYLVELCWPAAHFLFFSVFLLLCIPNLHVDMTINLSLILYKTRIQKKFPLFVFAFIHSLVVSA